LSILSVSSSSFLFSSFRRRSSVAFIPFPVSVRYSVLSLERGSASADAEDGHVSPLPDVRLRHRARLSAPHSHGSGPFSEFCASTSSYNGKQSLCIKGAEGSSLMRISTLSVRRHVHIFIRDVCPLRSLKAQWHHLLLTH
jgi:hypothetical protein